VQEQQDEQLPDDLSESPMRDDNGNNDWEEVDGIDAEGLEEPQPSSSSPKGANAEMSLHDTTLQSMDASVLEVQQRAVRKKKVKISKHGIQYPSLPLGVVKKLATTYARTSGNSKAKISKDTLDAIMQASDWFFEQVSDDLGAYAKHAGRKTIEESDVVTLMKRYVFPSSTTLVKSNGTSL
jgi:histone H3/H4